MNISKTQKKITLPVITKKNLVSPKSKRRNFLTKAASTVAIPIAGFPMISIAKTPFVFKMQGAWGSKDIMNEFAKEYVERVNTMAEGRLRIDYLNAGAVVKPF